MLRARLFRVPTCFLAGTFALLCGTTFIPIVTAHAAEAQRNEHTVRAASQPGPAAAAPSAAPPSADELLSHGNSLLETVRSNLERLIATQENLRARIASLSADLAAEKSRASQHVSERDEALRRAEEAVAINARLEAQAEAAQDALANEQERSRKLQEQADAAIQDLHTELAAMRTQRDDLLSQLASLSAARPAAPLTEPTAAAATQRMTAETAPASAPGTQPADKPDDRMAMLRDGERLGLAANEQPKSDNRENETSRAIESQLCLAVTAGETALNSTETDIAALRSRLEAATAAVAGLSNDTARQPLPASPNNAALDALQNLIERKTDALRQANGAIGDLSRGKAALIDAFERFRGEVAKLDTEQGEIAQDFAALERTNAETIDAFGAIRKRTTDLETAAEVLSIRQELNDFTTGQIRGAALAQHEAMLSTAATNLDDIARDVTTATAMRARLAGQAEALQARLQAFTAKLADVNERVASLSERTDAWLNKTASHRIAPFDDIASTLAGIRESAAQDGTAVAASAALVEQVKEKRKSVESDLARISETLDGLKASLTAVSAPLESLAAVLDGADHRPGTGLAAGECRDRAQILGDVEDVRQGLKARLVDITGLTEWADRVRRDLASASEAASRAENDLVALRRQQNDRLDRIEALRNRVGSLNEARRKHDRKMSAEAEPVAALASELKALSGNLAASDSEVRGYRVAAASLPAGETGDAEAIQRRVKSLVDRVSLLKAAVVSVKRPPPVPAKPPRPTASAPPPESEPPASPAQTGIRVEVSCNLALPSCRRWLHLREQQSLRAQPESAGEQRPERN